MLFFSSFLREDKRPRINRIKALKAKLQQADSVSRMYCSVGRGNCLSRLPLSWGQKDMVTTGSKGNAVTVVEKWELSPICYGTALPWVPLRRQAAHMLTWILNVELRVACWAPAPRTFKGVTNNE